MIDQTKVSIEWGIGLIVFGLFGLFIVPNMPIIMLVKINLKWLPFTCVIAVLGGLYLLISGLRSRSSRSAS